MKIIVLSSLICLLIVPVSILHAGDSLLVQDAWVLEAPPGMQVMAAYMTLKNSSESSHELSGVSSAQFERVEMHRTIIENEQARMEKQNKMTVKAGDTLKFEPGGNHLMLFNPEVRLKNGDKVDLNLKLNNGTVLNVKATVRNHSEIYSMEHSH
jgi:copper(I)-binding protein